MVYLGSFVNASPQDRTESEHLLHTDALIDINLQEQYSVKATQNILRAQTRQKLQYDKNTSQWVSNKRSFFSDKDFTING